jgi:hypothetical protein
MRVEKETRALSTHYLPSAEAHKLREYFGKLARGEALAVLTSAEKRWAGIKLRF